MVAGSMTLFSFTIIRRRISKEIATILDYLYMKASYKIDVQNTNPRKIKTYEKNRMVL